MKKISSLFVFLLIFAFQGFSQKEDMSQMLPAKWICSPQGSQSDFGVFYFRKSFELDSIPHQLIVHTSGDNRYQLFVNEKLAAWGPLRGDLNHWYYETTDIAPFLKEGKNLIAAVVWNYGAYPPDAQLSVRSGFLLIAGDRQNRFLNTNASWKTRRSRAYTPNDVDGSQVQGYYGGGAKEIVDGRRFDWGWKKLDFDDSQWLDAHQIGNAMAKTCKWPSPWKLVPRTLPLEKRQAERFKAVRIAENITIPPEFPEKPRDFTLPANSSARFVLDRGVETTAYPELKVSGGKDAQITFTYVEAPYIGEPSERNKGNRNQVKGKTFFGFFDRFIADGGSQRVFAPLWWRAYRYIEVKLQTKDQPLTIHDIRGHYSSYPFEMKATFNAQTQHPEIKDSTIQKIFEIGERSMRLCSHETYMDCPYYEESQFEGDTRVEMLVSYFNFGDPALAKNAINQFHWSLNSEGFLSARYPTNSTYYIANFSIFWIAMLHDYLMYYGEPEFLKPKLQAMRTILHYFVSRERSDGTIKKPDYHNFVDWSFPQGEPPFGERNYSAVVDLHVLLAYQWATELEKQIGEPYFARMYAQKAQRLSESIKALYWNEKLELFTDTPDSEKLSQHTNALAILAGVTQGKQARSVMKKVLENKDDKMVKATLYWSFYLFEALDKAGPGNEYLNHLDVWLEVMKLGVTTWPETGARSRSECHAWGASPNYHFLKIIAGIHSAVPGFSEIRIEPNLEKIKTLSASMPHHLGEIAVKYQRKGKNELRAEIDLPPGTRGTIVWQGKEKSLKSGKQEIFFR